MVGGSPVGAGGQVGGTVVRGRGPGGTLAPAHGMRSRRSAVLSAADRGQGGQVQPGGHLEVEDDRGDAQAQHEGHGPPHDRDAEHLEP
ncbi:hypothetical protein [Ornithinimicrobium kibberense]|uniref:hypothetical protein n=1 Tax=Ornithinimicrobium kibberense TaxID=282060 RepID=UPI00360895CE